MSYLSAVSRQSFLLPTCYQIGYLVLVWFNMIRHEAIQSNVADTRVIIGHFVIM